MASGVGPKWQANLGHMSDVTRILSPNEQRDSQAAEKNLPLQYAELRKLAAANLTH